MSISCSLRRPRMRNYFGLTRRGWRRQRMTLLSTSRHCASIDTLRAIARLRNHMNVRPTPNPSGEYYSEWEESRDFSEESVPVEWVHVTMLEHTPHSVLDLEHGRPFGSITCTCKKAQVQAMRLHPVGSTKATWRSTARRPSNAQLAATRKGRSKREQRSCYSLKLFCALLAVPQPLRRMKSLKRWEPWK